MGSLPKDQTGTIGAPAGTVENTLDSCGTATDSATQVKGFTGLLVTKISNRKEEESRTWMILFKVLFDIIAFWKQVLTYFTVFCNEQGSDFRLPLRTQAVNIHCMMLMYLCDACSLIVTQ